MVLRGDVFAFSPRAAWTYFKRLWKFGLLEFLRQGNTGIQDY